jgi:hypothetical protein
MKIVFFSESQVFGKIPRDFENSRVEYAWMIALDAVHCNIKQVDRLNEKFDLGIVIVPKTNPDVGLAPYREICKNVAVMQEGPHWYFQDYSVDKQFYYYNTLMDADWVYCHNKVDLLYFRGLGCKDVRVMRSLMIPERLSPRAEWEDKIMIGGNFVSWYGGFDSYMVAIEIGDPIWAPSMGRKQEQEDAIEDIRYMDYMSWREWISALSQFNIGVHLMRTHAAGTFAMNCAFHGIPCIGYKGLDTQETCHPLTTVRLGDLEGAVLQAKKLKNNKDFYKLCSDTTKKRFKNSYTEKAWLDRWEYING